MTLAPCPTSKNGAPVLAKTNSVDAPSPHSITSPASASGTGCRLRRRVTTADRPSSQARKRPSHRRRRGDAHERRAVHRLIRSPHRRRRAATAGCSGPAPSRSSGRSPARTGRQLNRQLARLRAAEDAVEGVGRRTPQRVRKFGPVGEHPAGGDEGAGRVDGRRASGSGHPLRRADLASSHMDASGMRISPAPPSCPELGHDGLRASAMLRTGASIGSIANAGAAARNVSRS